MTVMLLEDTPAVLSREQLCEDHGYNYHWTSGQIPLLIKNDRKIECNTANFVPFVIPGLPTSSSSSSSPTSPASSSLEAVTTEHPASTRSKSVSDEVRGDSSRDLSRWLEEFKGNLLDESVPEHRDASSSSSGLLSEPRAKLVRVSTAEGPKLRYLLENQKLRGLHAECIGTVVPRADFFGDLTTAGHKVLSEESHRGTIINMPWWYM